MMEPHAESLLQKIGETLAGETDKLASEVFLYAEVEPAMISYSIFVDYGESVLFRSASQSLVSLLYDFWLAEPEAKRWAAMKYIIIGQQFETIFTYPDEIDPTEDQDDRRDRIVAERYHNKQVIF